MHDTWFLLVCLGPKIKRGMILCRKLVSIDSILTKVSFLVFKRSQDCQSLIHSQFQQLRAISGTPVKSNTPLIMPSQNNRSVITISVDGNISSGKSTLVSNLKELFPNNFDFQVELVPEPLEKWTNLRGHNLLGMFYEDRINNNFMFQHYVQLTRLMEAIKKPADVSGADMDQKGTVRILERSLQNNRYCFTELARREGKLKPEEFAVLSEWHSWLEQKFDLTLDAIVYLRTDPQTVYNRMQKRGRSEESTVPFDYLSSLHETYENWLVRGNTGLTASSSLKEVENSGVDTTSSTTSNLQQRVIVIDGNQGIQEVAQECKSRLKTFMNDLGFTDKKSSAATEPKICANNDVDILA